MEIVDRIIGRGLQQHLKWVEGVEHSHPDDIKYYKKLKKALKRTLEYFGESTNVE